MVPVMVPSLDTPKLRSRADQLRADQSGRDEIPGSQRAEGGPWAMGHAGRWMSWWVETPKCVGQAMALASEQ